MTDKPQPDALRLAELLTADEWPGHMTLVSYARECVAELRRLHAENETLRAGYAAARLEIESLKAQLHAAKQINAAQFGLLAASIPGAALRASHGQAPAQAAPAAVAGPSEAVKFTDQSTADPVEKARRYLTAMCDQRTNSAYFYDDGYPRLESAQDALATLAVLEQLAAAPTTQPAPVAPGESLCNDPRLCCRSHPHEDQSQHCQLREVAAWLRWLASMGRVPSAESMLDRAEKIDSVALAIAAPAAQGDALDAARWRMAALVGNEVMVHPDKRNHAAAVAAYMQAVSSGLDLTTAIDAARAAQEGKSNE